MDEIGPSEKAPKIPQPAAESEKASSITKVALKVIENIKQLNTPSGTLSEKFITYASFLGPIGLAIQFSYLAARFIGDYLKKEPDVILPKEEVIAHAPVQKEVKVYAPGRVRKKAAAFKTTEKPRELLQTYGRFTTKEGTKGEISSLISWKGRYENWDIENLQKIFENKPMASISDLLNKLHLEPNETIMIRIGEAFMIKGGAGLQLEKGKSRFYFYAPDDFFKDISVDEINELWEKTENFTQFNREIKKHIQEKKLPYENLYRILRF